MTDQRRDPPTSTIIDVGAALEREEQALKSQSTEIAQAFPIGRDVRIKAGGFGDHYAGKTGTILSTRHGIELRIHGQEPKPGSVYPAFPFQECELLPVGWDARLIRTVIESPFGRNPDGSKCTPEQYARNIRYLNRALLDSIRRGEAPYASHRFYPGLLDDTNPDHRALGMKMGLVWSEAAQRVAVYNDHDITEGMAAAIAQHRARGLEIVYRSIGAEPELP